MSKLFSPLTIKGITFRNRLAMAPMCQYSANNGFASDWHLAHYGSRAAGGAGLIIQEATAVAPEGRITPGDLGIYDDAQLDKLQQLTSFIHQQGAIAGIQLAHAGRKAACAVPWEGGIQLSTTEGGWPTVSASSLSFNPSDIPPHALSVEEIQKVIDDFTKAAQRALASDYKVVEIHAAHGYLIHQFLSPLTNHRNDRYGGSFENRILLLLEITQAVRKVWPEEHPLFVRISVTDWVEGGWNPDEAVLLCKKLKTEGVDLIDCSSGGTVPTAQVPFGPNYQVPFAEKIRQESEILTGAVGLITKAQQAETILNEGKADLILLGRLLLRDPFFPLKAAHELGDNIQWPLQYLRGKA